MRAQATDPNFYAGFQEKLALTLLNFILVAGVFGWLKSHTVRLTRLVLLPLLLGMGLGGCSRNPSLEISGSFFPAWMLSIFIGLVATLVAKRIFLAKNLDPHLTPHLLVYGALMVSFTLLTWLLLYW